MDKTYYDNNLAYLFSSNDPVYKINPIFKQFTIEINDSSFAYTSFLQNITNLEIRNQNPLNDKINYQEEIKKYMGNLQNSGKTFAWTNSFVNYVQPGLIEIYIHLVRNTVDFKNIGPLFYEMKNNVLTNNHDEMHKFLRTDNIELVSEYQFLSIFKKEIIDKIVNKDCGKPNSPSTCNNIDYSKAIEQLATSIADSEAEDIYKDLTKVSANAIEEIINNVDFIPSNLITQLGIGTETSFESSPFYYRLRAKLVSNSSKINELFPRSISTNTMMYIRKILADLYIKTSYLTIHFDILSSLQKKHQKLGDFMNARFGILAMTNFTYMYIHNILENVKLLSNNANTIANLKTRLDLMSNYIIGLSNIEHSNKNSFNNLAKIIKDLHTKSYNNYTKSLNISELKQEIHKHQIALNNIVVNSQNIQHRYKLKYAEFVFITMFLFVIIITCSILFIFKKSTLVIWIAMNVMRVIIVFLIVKLLTFFIYKN